MENENYPLTNYNFMLRVEGAYDLPCRSISGIVKENEYEYIQEGGVNDYVHIRRKPAGRPKVFQIECYVGSQNMNPLRAGTKCVLPLMLFVSRYPGDFSSPKLTYTFTGCVVIAKEYGQMDAEKGGILTEKMTIAYEEMMCMDNIAEKSSPVWKFEGNKPEGNGVRRARTPESMGITAQKKETRLWPEKKSHKEITKYLKQ